jgi:hypothetical protein
LAAERSLTCAALYAVDRLEPACFSDREYKNKHHLTTLVVTCFKRFFSSTTFAIFGGLKGKNRSRRWFSAEFVAKFWHESL